MDKTTEQTNHHTLQAAIARGPELGLNWETIFPKPQPGRNLPDVHLRLVVGKRKKTYSVEIKRALRPAILGAVIHQLTADGKETLLVTDYVTPPLAEELREKGIQFIDGAGNAYLRAPDLFVWVKGQRPKEPAGERREGRAFQPSGLRVLFALLCQPELVNFPYREIADRAGVAHGTVGWVIPELQRMGYVATLRRRRRLVDPEKLLGKWVEAYARTLRPKLVLGRYKVERLDWIEGFDCEKYNLLLGGEPAASQMTGYLRPGTATLYGRDNNPRLILDKQLRADKNGNVEILRHFWNFEVEDPDLTPPLLVYADLLAIGDARCIDTARLLYEEHIAHRLIDPR